MLTKTPININFGQGLDTKSDPYQVHVGKFLQLQNSVFDTAGRLTKRNGFNSITNLPNINQTTITTLNNNLIATGSDLFAYSQDTNQWIDKGSIQPVQLSAQTLVRASTSQSGQDAAVASNGLICTVYMDNSAAYFQISDSSTGTQIRSRTSIASIDLTSTATNAPRVFVVGNSFVVTYLSLVAATPHLRYIPIPTANPNAILGSASLDIGTSVAGINAGYDAVVVNNTLYYAWAASSISVRMNLLPSTFVSPSSITTSSTHSATQMSVTVDNSNPANPTIWTTFYDAATSAGYTVAYDSTLTVVRRAELQTITATNTSHITSSASAGVLTLFVEVNNTYAVPYPTSNVKSDYITKQLVTTAGLSGSPVVVLRSVGLGSKSFIVNSTIYMLAVYDVTTSGTESSNEPTYFLIDSSGNIYMRLASTNAGGYVGGQVLPSVSSLNSSMLVPYLIKDFLAAVNKGFATGLPANGVYTQTGINLATFTINTVNQYSNEIAGALHLTGGQLWEFDGVKPVEQGFQVYPEATAGATSAVGGSIDKAQAYYYSFTYEWTDNQGMLHRSAPSIPLVVTTTGTASTNTLYVPTNRLTYKVTPNPVRIVGYRWSTGQQVSYQFTSITSPVVNDPTVDYVTIVDNNPDSIVLGNTILYTTGGVVENIAAPASVASCLYKNRLFLVDAEDRNLLWYSKQVIEAVPVEMSDLFTIYVAPTSGAQGSTGPTTALSAMDDKLIVFKRDSIYYITGSGPDNTGSSNDFSDPIYVTSSVGCSNPSSIVLMPSGIMFQSDKGIWLLGRDLTTNYIGAAVEAYNSNVVESAIAIPGTNQVRFILNSGITLMYDYYFEQWGTFSNIYAISATLYNGAHTYLNKFGVVYQETPQTYLDGSTPVLMSFQTSWINLTGIQGFQRFYFMYLLGTYYTPYTLNVQLAYNYSLSASQSVIVKPDNYSPNWGGDPVWGSSTPWGGPGNVFEARVFPETQKCETFQVTVNELYDPSLGVASGQGLTLSGLNLVVGAKKGYRVQSAGKSFG